MLGLYEGVLEMWVALCCRITMLCTTPLFARDVHKQLRVYALCERSLDVSISVVELFRTGVIAAQFYIIVVDIVVVVTHRVASCKYSVFRSMFRVDFSKNSNCIS